MEWAFTISGREKNIPMLWSAYADDITFFLREPSAVDKVFQVFNEVSKISEADINVEKSSALIVRNPRHMRLDLEPVCNISHPIVCLKDSIKILGITFLMDSQCIASKQFQDIFDGVSAQLSKNFNRLVSMSYLNRAGWINSRIWPRWLYVLKCLHPTREQIHLIQNQMLDILWMGGKHWLNLSTVCRPRKEGGLSLVNVESKLAAIRTSTIIRVMSLETSNVQKELTKAFLGQYGDANLGFTLFCINPESQHLQDLSEIYRATLLSWQTFKIIYSPRNLKALLDMPVAMNKFLGQAASPVKISITQALEKGLYTIRDLIELPEQRTRFWKTAKLDALVAIEEWEIENTERSEEGSENLNKCEEMSKGERARSNDGTCPQEDDAIELLTRMSIMTDWDKFEGLDQMTPKSLYLTSIKDRGAESFRCCQEIEENAWIVAFSMLSPPAHNNYQWRFLHGKDLSQNLLWKIRGGESQECLMCGGYDYSKEHTYNGCAIVRPLRANVWAMLDELGFSPTDREEEQLYKGDNSEELLANFLIKTYRYTVALLLRRTGLIKRPNGEKLRSTFYHILKCHLKILVEKKPPDDILHTLYWTVWTCRNVISQRKQRQLCVRSEDGTFVPI